MGEEGEQASWRDTPPRQTKPWTMQGKAALSDPLAGLLRRKTLTSLGGALQPSVALEASVELLDNRLRGDVSPRAVRPPGFPPGGTLGSQ